VLGSFPSCPIGEVARAGRTLRQWRPQVLAYFATSGSSEAINLLIEKTAATHPASANSPTTD
jgi:transposase